MRLFVCCHHAKKPENGLSSDLFNLTPKYFLPLLPYSDLVPPSTDPVPPSANQYRPILTNYHYVSTITALYWSSTNKYQQVSPHTHPVPSCIASTAFYWPRTIMYQPVPASTDPLPLYINQYHSILTQYHQVSTSTNLYCCCMEITDFCTVYPGSCYHRKQRRKYRPLFSVPFLCCWQHYQPHLHSETIFIYQTQVRW